MIRSLLFITLTLGFFPSLLNAQSDVCCVSAKIVEEGVETNATLKASTECAAGGSSAGFQVCYSFSDAENNCPNVGEKDRCTKCGYFWTGKTCLKDDPVKKAEEALKEKEKTKK